jgi:hypothetical protein
VGSALSLPSKSPRTNAEPTETRICCGKSVSAQVWVFANCPTERKTIREGYISLKFDEAGKGTSLLFLISGAAPIEH